jgi:hypothetical protein
VGATKWRKHEPAGMQQLLVAGIDLFIFRIKLLLSSEVL